MYLYNRTCHHCIPVLKTSLRMAMLSPKHGGGISYSDKFLLLSFVRLLG
jgi:hypothetical protein